MPKEKKAKRMAKNCKEERLYQIGDIIMLKNEDDPWIIIDDWEGTPMLRFGNPRSGARAWGQKECIDKFVRHVPINRDIKELVGAFGFPFAVIIRQHNLPVNYLESCSSSDLQDLLAWTFKGEETLRSTIKWILFLRGDPEKKKTQDLTAEHVKNVCRPGEGEKSCSFLVMGGKGFSCAKCSGSKELIATIYSKRFMENMVALGDNCMGRTGNIFPRANEFSAT